MDERTESRSSAASQIDAELMTVEEFAAVTRRTKSAVIAAILRGDIPAHKLGSRRWWIRRRDIMALFEAQGHKPRCNRKK